MAQERHDRAEVSIEDDVPSCSTALTSCSTTSSSGGSSISRCSENLALNALPFALPYLDSIDCLRLQMVCKSLQRVVQDDPSLWRRFQWKAKGLVTKKQACAVQEALALFVKRSQGQLRQVFLPMTKSSEFDRDVLVEVLSPCMQLEKLHAPLKSEDVVTLMTAQEQRAQAGGCTPRLSSVNFAYNVNSRTDQIPPEHFAFIHQKLTESRRLHKMSPSSHAYCFHERGYDRGEHMMMPLERCVHCGRIREVFHCTRSQNIELHQECHGCSNCKSWCAVCSGCIASPVDLMCGCKRCSGDDCIEKLPSCTLCGWECCTFHVEDFSSGMGSDSAFLCTSCAQMVVDRFYDV